MSARKWSSILAILVVLGLWCGFAAWQYAGYRHERDVLRESLRQQTHSVLHALIGGAGSHRRRGQFYEDQLQGMLDELVDSGDVLAAAIFAADGSIAASAGSSGLLRVVPDDSPGAHWDDAGLRLVEQFELEPADAPGMGGPGGRFGRGQGPRARLLQAMEDGALDAGGTKQYVAALVVDRTGVDALVRRAARSHLAVTLAGGLVLALAAWAWRASVKTVAAEGRADLLKKEARFLRDFRQAAAGLAHETRNPLGLIRGWTQRLAQTEGDPARREQAQAVIEECDWLTARINQFLAFAKPPSVNLVATPLAPLVAELAMLLQPDLDDKHLRLEQSLSEACASVLADRELLRQALFNLLQNAIHFSPAGESIQVASAMDAAGQCRIDVSDHGPGVAAEAVDSLFTPYFTTRPDGTGLGLAIVQQIANVHGWQVRYEPRPGGGALFSLVGIHG